MIYRILLKIIFVFSIFSSIAFNTKADDTTCRASFSYIETGFGEFTFTNKSFCNSGQKVKFYWDFGDGSPVDSVNENPVHQYKRAGIYTVRIITIGKTDYTYRSYTNTISVKGLCKYDFSPNTRYLTVIIKLPLLDQEVFELDFGDGSKEYTSNNKFEYTHTYKSAGQYTISFYMVSSKVCADTVRKTVNVVAPTDCSTTIFPTTQNDPQRTVIFNVDYFKGFIGSFYEWDFGDGSKDTGINRYTVMHQYAADGDYKVTLKTTNKTYSCTDTTSVNISVKKVVYPAEISGFVTYLDSATNAYFSVDTAMVFLIQYNELDSALHAIDTILTFKDTGKVADFYFTNLAPGKYMIKAALGKNSKFIKDYIPTYYYASLTWDKADTLVLIGAQGEAIRNLEIVPIKGINTSTGIGFIGGKVVAGANKKEGDPLENVQVTLYNSIRQPVAHTYSDMNGNYSFKNLAFGRYEIYTEIIGVRTVSAFVNLTQTDSVFNSVIIKVSTDGIVTEVLTGVKEANVHGENIRVYPNPASNTLYINYLSDKPQAIDTEIYGIDGRRMLAVKHNVGNGNQALNLNIGELPTGTYMLVLKNASTGEVARYKFVKLQ